MDIIQKRESISKKLQEHKIYLYVEKTENKFE